LKYVPQFTDFVNGVMLLSVSEQRRKIRTGVIRTSKERTGKRLDQKNLLAEEGR
jgi:hypothetical protein